MNDTTDKKQFIILMELLSEAFPQKEPVSKTRAKLYFEFLKCYSIEQVSNAIKTAIRTLDFFPSIHMLIQIMGQFPDEPERNKINFDLLMIENKKNNPKI